MANLTVKIIFKLLLIITMVIQPVAITHAMASMDHSQHQASFANKQSHDGHHEMHQDVPDAQHDSHESSDNSDMNNCCNSAACCPAALVGMSNLEQMPVPEYSAYLLGRCDSTFRNQTSSEPSRLDSLNPSKIWLVELRWCVSLTLIFTLLT